MANFTIRNFDDGLYKKLKERAAANQRSLEAEARHLLLLALAQSARKTVDRAELLKRIDAIRASVKPSDLDAVALIREERDHSLL